LGTIKINKNRIKKMENTFLELSKIDTSELKEKKGRFDYLSWAVALRELLKKYPKATFKVHEYNDSPYMSTELGFFVKVSVTVEGVEHAQIHPILDNRNIPITNPNAFQVNTSIQRCLAKAIALHGLGLCLFAGEDLAGLDTPSSDTKGTLLPPSRHSTNESKAPSFSSKPASDKQKGLLSKLNVNFSESITSKEASQLIEKNMNKPPAKNLPENPQDNVVFNDLKQTVECLNAKEDEFVEIMKGMIDDCPHSKKTELRKIGRSKLEKIRSEQTE
jgi:hypothetical protein